MKTIRRPRSRNKIWVSAWIGIGLLAILFIINFMGVFAAFPLMKAGQFLGDAGANVLGAFSAKNSIETENENLRNKLAEVQVMIDRDKLLVQENSELKNLLGRKTKGQNTILATVLSKPPLSLYDTAVLDVGSSDGVKKGDMVMALGSVPIGVIGSVTTHTSVAELYSSAGQKINVRVGKNIQTIAEAQSGGNFLIKLPKGSEVGEGDIISAPGINADVFGHVESLYANENDPFIYLRFTLLVNISELRFVQIERS